MGIVLFAPWLSAVWVEGAGRARPAAAVGVLGPPDPTIDPAGIEQDSSTADGGREGEGGGDGGAGALPGGSARCGPGRARLSPAR
nr:hypothetical protein KitaXyl93_05200 [Kitasatospora sp. Xyl93]